MTKNYRFHVLFISLLGLCLIAEAQQQQVLRTNADHGSLHALVPLDVAISVHMAADYLHAASDLSRFDRLEEHSRITDKLGELHIRYKHYYQGTPVVGSQLIAHFKDGKMHSYNGQLLPVDLGLPALSEVRALTKALEAVAAEKYSWEDEAEVEMLRSWTNDSNASYYPTGELVYAVRNFGLTQESQGKKAELCYRFSISAIEPLLKQEIYIHAGSGEVWAVQDLIHVTDVPGTANTKYRGVRPIVADSVSPGNYRLRESGRGGGIETYNMQTGTSYAAAVDFTDADNYWNNYNAQFDEIAGDAHFGAEVTYDYFQDKFSRNSFDNNGAKIRSYVHYRSNYSNAFWNGAVMTYGDGNGTSVTPLTSIDVCGHEISHAVTTHSAGLIYSYESGALNESFSDIFGNAIEYYADSNQFNWRIGEDILVSGNGIRNMANPNTHGDPDTYQGTFWHTAATDNGGVHTNSGVQNFWFYLLCEGGTGTNDNGDAYVVDSLGIEKAEAVAYRNLTVYLGPSSQYDDARYYAIRSAADLFGECSDEVIAVTNAWYAVGVGPEYDSLEVTADFSADTLFCRGNELVQFSNRSTNAQSYEWDFGDGNGSTVTHPVHQYFAQGSFDVQLIAEACFGSNRDTMFKSAYVVIDSSRDICNAILMPLSADGTVFMSAIPMCMIIQGKRTTPIWCVIP